MSEAEKRGRAAEAAGNLLSSVAPPSVLPNFVTAATSPHQPATVALPGQPSELASVPALAAQPPQAPPDSPDHFSPAIPPSKGEPTLAIRSPEGSQTTTQSPDSPPASTPDADHIGDPMPGSGLLTWVRGAVATGGPSWLYRVAEKAKSSVDSMITTLDPQMKEYLNSGGDIQIVVTSDKDWDISPIREAFQIVFGKATVIGVACTAAAGGEEATAPQLVGARAAYAAAKHRLAQLRAADAQLHNNVPLIAVEPYLDELPADKWCEVTLLLLSQPSLGLELAGTSQSTNVPAPVVAALRAATPPDYPLAASGLAVTAGSVIAQSLQVRQREWQEAVSGVPRRDVLLLAARSLAGSYKRLLEMSATAPTI